MVGVGMSRANQEVSDEDACPVPEPWRSQLEASRLRLCGDDLPSQPWSDLVIGQSGGRQAVLGELRLKDVRRVTHFVGCCSRSLD
jgi:hypothetical protein